MKKQMQSDKMLQNRNFFRFLAAGLGVIVAGVVVMCAVFVMTLYRSMGNDAERYLTEVSVQIAEMVNYRVDRVMRSMESTADTYIMLKKFDQAAADSFLKDEVLRYDYRWIDIIDLDGKGRSTMGQETDLSQFPAVMGALQGNNEVTGLMRSPVDGSEGILYAVPLRDQGKVVGAVSCWSDKSQIQDLLMVESFGGAGYSEIINRDGDFLITSANENAFSYSANLFDMIRDGSIFGKKTLNEVYQAIQTDQSGIFHYALEDGVAKTMNYLPLETDGWYLLAIVPDSVTYKNTNDMLLFGFLMIGVIILSLGCLFFGFVIMNRKYNSHLYQLAFVDHVTGGTSRVLLEMQADRMIREAPPGSYIYISMNIQRFKLLNDSFGKENGDKTLKYIYDVIRSSLKEQETAARIAADQFELLIEARPEEQILGFLEGMTEQINSFNDKLKEKYYISLDVGVYLIDDENLPFVNIQDRAATARKNPQNTSVSGRFFCCTFYDDADRHQMLREREMGNRMEEALEHGEFVVYLQPKVELKSRRINGAEALVRWKAPGRGIIPPGEFIPFFESNGFIVKLDLYVFEQVCAWLRRWVGKGHSPIVVSVNLSQAHLSDPDFLKRYVEIRQQYELDPGWFEIELTETMVFANVDRLKQIIGDIHEAGFLCSMDDFGSGYSSLNMLSGIRVDTLKMDKGFFDEFHASDERKCNVIESVIHMADKLHMLTVAEGIETEEQLEFLQTAGCGLVQGYVFARPLPAADFEELCRKYNRSGGESE